MQFSTVGLLFSGMEPTTSEYIGGIWYEINDAEAWKTMMERVDQGLPPTDQDVVDEASGTILASTGSGQLTNDNGDLSGGGASQMRQGTVAVRNGNGVSGAGSQAAERVESLGYTVESGNADSFDYERTMIVYDDASDAERAQEIAEALGVGQPQQNDGSYLFDSDFLVVLGADWE